MRILIIVLAIVFAAPLHAADQPNPAEAKLREGLKNTMLQLRTVQGEKAALEAAKVELEGKVTELTERVEKIEKDLLDAKAAAEKKDKEQTERLVEKGNYAMKLETDLNASQKAHKEASALAAKKEGERAKLLSEKVVLQRKVEDQQTRNLEMYKVGMEVLTRLEKFGLGTAIAAREPFVGLTKVKFQNLIQDYGDKLVDQKIKP
jgi:SMC interacting uncharacterized protein involved in chromosome segregation